MADLIPKDTDEEIERYMEADMVRRARIPMEGNAALKFEADPITKRENAYFPLSSGGYVKIGDRAVKPKDTAKTDVLAAARDIQNDARGPISEVMGGAEGPTMADYEAAGFTEAEVLAFQAQEEARMLAQPGMQVPVQLTPEQVQFGVDVGAPMIAPRATTLRDRVQSSIFNAMSATEEPKGPVGEAVRSMLQGITGSELIDPADLRFWSNYLTDVVDITVPGVGGALSLDEGARIAQQGYQTGNAVDMLIGGVVFGMGAAELVPIFKSLTGPARKVLADNLSPEAKNLLADAIGTGRAIAQRDREMLMEIFQPAGTPRSLGAAAPNGFEDYLSRVNPTGTRVAAEDRPNLMMGDMYGMLPKNARRIGKQGDVTFYRGPEGDFYATAFNPDVGEQDVVGYIIPRGDMTELAVVGEMQGRGVGGELQYLFRRENPNAPTGGLTEAGERSLRRTYDRLVSEGIIEPTPRSLGAAAPDPETAGAITAFHGSPYDFDAFDITKMGTGEGAQAYGPGLYFAESEDVARNYRSALAQGMGDGNLRAAGVADGDLRAMRQFTQSAVDPGTALRDWLHWIGKKETPELRDAFMRDWSGRNDGRLYEVNINANLEDFLNWDAPISQQSEKVREALMPFVERRIAQMGEAGNRFTLEQWMDRLRGGDVMLLDKVEDAPVSSALIEAGVPGVRYFDQGSRAAEEGTRNYVVFDDKLIDIVRKYGVAGLAIGAAVQSELGVNEQIEENI